MLKENEKFIDYFLSILIYLKILTICLFRQVPWLYLVTPTRWLVSQVTCTRLCWRESHDKMTWGRKVSRQRLQLLLFTDLLLVCKKKRYKYMWSNYDNIICIVVSLK